jgi:Flp pilus assembly protein TadD
VQAHHAQARPEEALAQLDEAIALAPDEAELHSRRAQLLYRVGRPEEAIESLRTFLRLSDRDFDDPDIVAALEMMTTWEREIELAVAP